MAIVESDSDSDTGSGRDSSLISPTPVSTPEILSTLRIPLAYARRDRTEETADAEVINELARWKARALQGLIVLRARVEEFRSKMREENKGNAASTANKAKKGETRESGDVIKEEDIVWRVARFRGTSEEWSDAKMSELSRGIILLLPYP